MPETYNSQACYNIALRRGARVLERMEPREEGSGLREGLGTLDAENIFLLMPPAFRSPNPTH